MPGRISGEERRPKRLAEQRRRGGGRGGTDRRPAASETTSGATMRPDCSVSGDSEDLERTSPRRIRIRPEALSSRRRRNARKSDRQDAEIPAGPRPPDRRRPRRTPPGRYFLVEKERISDEEVSTHRISLAMPGPLSRREPREPASSFSGSNPSPTEMDRRRFPARSGRPFPSWPSI